jgi:hypothetical protein
LPFTPISGLACAARGFALVCFRTGGCKAAFGFAFGFVVALATTTGVVTVTVGGVAADGSAAGAAVTGAETVGGCMTAQLSFPATPSFPASLPFAHGRSSLLGGGGGSAGGGGGAGGGDGGGGGGVGVPQLSDCVAEAEPPPSAVHDVDAVTEALPVRLSTTSNVPAGPVIVNTPDATVPPLTVIV